MGRIFGKDGMRAIAGKDLTCEIAVKLGRAAAAVLAGHKGDKPKILIGKDVRNSSDMIEAALCSGICSAGVDVELLGEVPTPLLAWYIRESESSGGIMITASPINSEYNGIKIFSSYGYRLGEDMEEEIEKFILDNPEKTKPVQRKSYGKILHNTTAEEKYISHIKKFAPESLEGFKVAIDCANGCTGFTAEKIFSGLGAEILITGDTPDGFNINTCGSTHIESLMNFVTENKCTCGIAFDGAGERCLAVDEQGNLVDGDVIIASCAKEMKSEGRLRHNTLLISQANNLGLIQFAKANEIAISSVPTGERGMIRRMIECGYSIGGDPSGHILFPDDMPTADGQLTGMRLLEILKKTGSTLSEISGLIKKSPQVMFSIPIDRKFREVWKNDKAITGLIEDFEGILGEDGRVVVREAGKEPAIRIRIEGKDFSTINTMALQIADTIKERLELADNPQE